MRIQVASTLGSFGLLAAFSVSALAQPAPATAPASKPAPPNSNPQSPTLPGESIQGKLCYFLDPPAKPDKTTNVASLCLGASSGSILVPSAETPGTDAVSMTFSLKKIKTSRCAECNNDVYQVTGVPALAKFKLAFHGSFDRKTNNERGTLTFGGVTFRYVGDMRPQLAQ